MSSQFTQCAFFAQVYISIKSSVSWLHVKRHWPRTTRSSTTDSQRILLNRRFPGFTVTFPFLFHHWSRRGPIAQWPITATPSTCVIRQSKGPAQGLRQRLHRKTSLCAGAKRVLQGALNDNTSIKTPPIGQYLQTHSCCLDLPFVDRIAYQNKSVDETQREIGGRKYYELFPQYLVYAAPPSVGKYTRQA